MFGKKSKTILYNNITKFSFNPYFPERSVQRFLKTKLIYILIFIIFGGTLKRFYEEALMA